jgi:ABC-type branched-subunit amino acid transport system substrate-binding protein
VPYTVKIAGATKVASLGYGVSENSKVCAQSVADSIDLYSADIGAEMAYFNDSLGYGLPNGIAPEVTQMKELGVDFISTCMDLNAMKTMAQELARQGMGDVVLYHPNTYNHPFVAEAGDLFDGDFVTPQFMPFEADADNAMQTAFTDTMAELGRELSELAMVGWINADEAYTAILSAGPLFDRQSAIDALNSQTDYDAGGLIVPVDWSRQHVPPVEGDAANDYALECFAPVRMSGGAFETVADPATPWLCWDNTTLDWAEPTQTVFGG